MFKYFCIYANVFTFKEAVARVYKYNTKKNKSYLSSVALSGMPVVNFSILF